MMPYVETSVPVAASTPEAETERMQDWLAAQAPGSLLISDRGATEFPSTLSIKLRGGRIGERDRGSGAVGLHASRRVRIAPPAGGPGAFSARRPVRRQERAFVEGGRRPSSGRGGRARGVPRHT